MRAPRQSHLEMGTLLRVDLCALFAMKLGEKKAQGRVGGGLELLVGHVGQAFLMFIWKMSWLMGQRVLVEGLRQSMLTGRANPFAGELHSQGGIVQKRQKQGILQAKRLFIMSWLNENVIGRLPEQRELSFDSLKQVEVSGLIPLDPATLPL